MAVYTDVAADELSEFLCRDDLGELLSDKGIAEGVEHSNFLVHPSQGVGDYVGHFVRFVTADSQSTALYLRTSSFFTLRNISW